MLHKLTVMLQISLKKERINAGSQYSDYVTVRGSSPSRGEGIFSSPQHLPLLWGPPSLQFIGHQASSPEVKRSVHEVNHLHLVQRLRMSGVMPLPPYAFVTWTGKPLP